MDFLFPIRGPIIIAAPGHFFRNSTFSNISTICRAITTGAGRHPLAPRLCCALSHNSDNLCSIGCTDAAKLHLPDTRASARAIFSLVVGSLALARMLGPLFAGAAHTLKAPLAQLTNIEPAEEPVDVGLVMDSDGRGRRQITAAQLSDKPASPVHPSATLFVCVRCFAASRVLIVSWTWDVSGPGLTVQLPAAGATLGRAAAGTNTDTLLFQPVRRSQARVPSTWCACRHIVMGPSVYGGGVRWR